MLTSGGSRWRLPVLAVLAWGVAANLAFGDIVNPILDGWYADPQIRRYGDEYWIFPTFSGNRPAGEGPFFDVFSSPDLQHWTKHAKALRTEDIPWAHSALWAPDAQEKDGKYYIFFSANDTYPADGSRTGTVVRAFGDRKYGGIGVAVSDRPEGPYRDLIGKPLIDQFWNGAQPIDPYVFEYHGEWFMLYGGWRRCNLVKLSPDFQSLLPLEDGTMWRDMTPPDYVEGSVMFERRGKWYFMYSSGSWTKDNYRVNYCVGESPFGPFEFKGKVLSSQKPIATGAGHNSVICLPGTDEWYICYHRRPIPSRSGKHRVTCLDRMFFDENGDILPIVMTERQANAAIQDGDAARIDKDALHPVDAPKAETVLWPSAETELHAQPDSSLATLADGAVEVRTGVEAAFPGARMDFLAGERDLSPFGRVVFSVSNTTDHAETVRLSVKGSVQGVEGQTPGGSVTLAPHAADELRVTFKNMPWALDAPLELVGMRGFPKEPGDGSTFDLRRVRSFHIFLRQDGNPGGFAVRRIVASGDGAEQKILPAATFLPFVDQYGQFAHDDWPGKVHGDADLAAAREAEAAWLAENESGPIPDADQYGGWAGGPQLKATGYFRTEKVDGKWWLVDPEGHLFFSHGVNAVFTGAETGVGFRENDFSWLPEKDDPDFGAFWSTHASPAAHGFYKDPAHVPFDCFDFAKANALRKYGHGWESNCAARAHARMRAWGLNTIAAWSSVAIREMRRTPYTAKFNTRGPVIEGSIGWWGKLRDPFAPEFASNVCASAAEAAAQSGDDPWCVGWFVDNELSWGSDDREIGRAVLRSPATQPAKAAARDLLAAKYGSAEALDAAWGTRYGTWDAFLAATNMPDEVRCGQDLADIHRAAVARYFQTVRDAVKAVAPHRLYLGCRIAWGRDVVYEECARYADVVSVNAYGYPPMRDLPPTAEDKPMLSGEFHFGALDRGMFHTGLVSTRDQNERAESYRAYVGACLDHPRYVGTHWFQWMDQALTGRPDGENYQIGFVTVTDAPYPELVQAARDVAATMYQRRYKQQQ